ncbi:MAG: sensor histidine kinase, partial [Promethearchaeota archaeon]
AGAKGIGRFSCDKLGSKLRLYTKKFDENYIHVLDVDWKEFEDKPKTQFQTISVEYERQDHVNMNIPTDEFSKGTILEISSLRSGWDRKKILRLKRHLQRLINPMKIGEQEFAIELEAKEYLEEDEEHRHEGDYAIVNGTVHNVVLEKLNLKTTNISCTLDDEGKSVHTELWDKGRFVFRLDEKNIYPELHGIFTKIFYLNRQAKATFTRLMGIQPVNYGSVFFYKNGIKINPYGNYGDDWLGLDRRKSQGVRRYFGSREVMGRIEVNGSQPGFVEVSSRDGGVIRSRELELLKELFTEKALRRLERYVVEGLAWDSEGIPKDQESIKTDSLAVITKLIGKKPDKNTKITFNKDLLEIYEEKQIEKTPEIIKNINSLKKHVPSMEEQDYLDKQIKTLANSFQKLQVEKEKLERELSLTESQNIFLRRLTDEEKEDMIGLQHHIVLATNVINNYLRSLKLDLDRQKRISREEMMEAIDDILLQTTLIRSMVMYVNKASFNVIDSRIRKDVVQFVKQYVENVYNLRYRRAIRKSRISINVVPEKGLISVHEFNPLDLVTIISNLIDNSRKAEASNVKVLINRLGKDGIEIRVKDDGKGIQEKDLDRIFELGFSTTGGTGIGLFAIKKIADENKWNIKVNELVDKGAEFILEMKK